jgi:hypothetical protein
MANDLPNTRIIEDDAVNLAFVLFNFGVGKSQLLPDHQRLLLNRRNDFVGAPDGTIVVAGAASPTGSHAFNLTLSQNRAKEVCRFLTLQLGVPPERFGDKQRQKDTGEPVGVGFGDGAPAGTPGSFQGFREDGNLRSCNVGIFRLAPDILILS